MGITQASLLTLLKQKIKAKDFKGKSKLSWFTLPNGDVIEKWEEYVPKFDEVRIHAAVYHIASPSGWGRPHRVCDPMQVECYYEKSFNKKYEKALKSTTGWFNTRPSEIPARS